MVPNKWKMFGIIYQLDLSRPYELKILTHLNLNEKSLADPLSGAVEVVTVL